MSDVHVGSASRALDDELVLTNANSNKYKDNLLIDIDTNNNDDDGKNNRLAKGNSTKND